MSKTKDDLIFRMNDLLSPINSNGLDCCIDCLGFTSDHDYQYAAGIGDAWKVTVDGHGGTLYNYGGIWGNELPHYPVPSLIGGTVSLSNIEGDMVAILLERPDWDADDCVEPYVAIWWNGD